LCAGGRRDFLQAQRNTIIWENAMKIGSLWLSTAFLLFFSGAAFAQGQGDEDLQKKLANPVSDLVSLPFQWTTNLHVGPLEKPQHTLNFQPVYPVKLGGGWSLINRAIVPFISSPATMPGQDRKGGLGDITYEGFFTPPPKEGGLILGVGPMLVLRTATDDRLGQGKWSLGPTFVALQQEGKWSLGGLVTQVWSISGDDQRKDVSAFSLQPIVSYRINPKYTVGYLGTLTADWKEHNSNRWTVPLGVSVSILTKPKDSVPMNFSFGVGYNAVRPDYAATWFLRAQVTFILPK
jgi:hypothetical protein